MSLDLGALVGRAIIDDSPFQRTYRRLVGQMGELGKASERAAAGTASLDSSLASAGQSGTRAAAGIDRAARSTSAAAVADDKAAAAASRHARAVAQVATIMNQTASESPRVQAATLRVAAAQERLNALQESGTATTRQLASAQAGLISAQRSLTAAQDSSIVATGRWRSGLMTAARTAGELGLLIGGIEIARKEFEFIAAGKHLTDALNSVQAASHATNEQMRAVRAQAIALGKDLTVPGATAVDAAKAIDDLVRSGMTLPRALAAARAALLLASAANVSTADSARVLGDVLDEFKIPASGATKVASILAAAGTSAAGGLMDVFQAFTYVGTRARALGLNVQDIAAAIIDLSKAGITADRAGTGLAMMLQRLASESPKGQRALDDLGVSAFNAQGKFVGLPKIIEQLHAAQQRMGTGSERFIKDISNAFGARAANVVAAFALRGIDGYNLMYRRLSSGDVQKAADLMNRGVGAGFRQLGKEATAAGIAVYQKLEGPATTAVMWLGQKLPAAVATAAHILGPFGHMLGTVLGSAWDLFLAGAKAVAAVLGPVVHLIDDLRGPLGLIGVTALGAYAGFKLFAAIPGLLDAVMARLVAAKAAVLGFATSSRAAAATTTASMTAISEEAALMSGTVRTEGAAAAAGWASWLGPLGAVAVGIGVIISIFHSSSRASREAAAAAKAYTDALGAGGTRADFLDAITKQLADNDVPQRIEALNKQLASGIPGVRAALASLRSQFGDTTFGGKEFLTAIEQGGKPLDQLRAKLHAVIDAGTVKGPGVRGVNALYDENGVNKAKALLADLEAQYGGLTKAQVKEIAAAKSFGQVVAPIQHVAQVTQLANDTATKYAAMMGFQVTKNNNVIGSSKAVTAAVRIVANAYDTATASGDEYLSALQTFSQSAGTAADRAALIGATLKSANGDALSFAASMASTTQAVDTLTGAFASQRDQLAQQSSAQSAAAARVAAAQARVDEVRGKSKHTAAELASAESALASAQAHAAKTGALAYADTERAALRFAGAGRRMKASIDTNAKGAGDLISQLQGIQDAAVKAAGAMFQHERAQKGAKQAADDAYRVYVNETRQALIDNHTQLGLTLTQAQALARAYFGLDGKHVKTTIESIGANPVLNVLNKIGRLLAHITGQQWDIHIGTVVKRVGGPHAAAVNAKTGQIIGPGFASGTGPGGMPDGWAWVGNELVHKAGSRVDILNAARSKVVAPLIGMGAPEGMRSPGSGASGAGVGTQVTVGKVEVNLNEMTNVRAAAAVPLGLRRAGAEIGTLI